MDPPSRGKKFAIRKTPLKNAPEPVSQNPSEPSPLTKTAGDVRKQGLDKFYTLEPVAKKCIESVGKLYEWEQWDLVVEPSAGNGSFLLQLPTEKHIGMDISPEHESIIKKDFFEYTPQSDKDKQKQHILVIGNPPFGKVSSTAIKFFNHAAKWADVIAFIIPRTFRRVSVQNKLDSKFHLKLDEEIAMVPCSFKPPMSVKCCFQVWEKSDTMREPVKLPTTHDDWEFLKFGPLDERGQPTPPTGAHFTIRAYGGKIGDIVEEEEKMAELRPKSWHWIKSKIDKKILIDRFKELDYSNSLNTARQNSMGRAELVSLYGDFINFETE